LKNRNFNKAGTPDLQQQSVAEVGRGRHRADGGGCKHEDVGKVKNRFFKLFGY